MASPEPKRPEPRDGRARRGERSRRQIVGALFALVGDGVLQPTAQQVADRAGVGLRTVFRHFEDMESLFAEMDARLRGEVTPLLASPAAAGALAGRVRALVATRAAFFERIAPYKRAGNVQRWRSAFLASNHRTLVRELRAALVRWLPELERARPELVEAVDLALSFEAWDRLRSEQRLGVERARETLEQLVLALLGRRAGGGRGA